MREIRLRVKEAKSPAAVNPAVGFGWVPDTSLNRMSLETIQYLDNRRAARPSYTLEERDVSDRPRE